MKKLTLDVEALAVETFETREIEEVSGTVQGHAARTFPDPVYTCAYHCTWYPGTTCE